MTEFEGRKEMVGEQIAGLPSKAQDQDIGIHVGGRSANFQGPGPKRLRNKDLQPVRQSSRRIIKKKWADDELPEYEIDTDRERHKVGC